MKILLVDDEALSRKATASFLEEQLGHDIIECGNGYEAKMILEEQSFPLIISDIRMPKMDGLELLKYIKEETSKSSDVVLITGHGDMDTAIKALRYGAYDFINKPIDVEQLAATVARSMERQALIIENQELKQKFQLKSLKNHFQISLQLSKNGLSLEQLNTVLVQELLSNFNNDKKQTADYLKIDIKNLNNYIV